MLEIAVSLHGHYAGLPWKGPVLVYYTSYSFFFKFHEFNRNSYDHVAEVLLVHN